MVNISKNAKMAGKTRNELGNNGATAASIHLRKLTKIILESLRVDRTVNELKKKSV